jgi:CheY-like chemotaxis protein
MRETSSGETLLTAPPAPARTVLIVDDDEEIRHVLRLMCELEGFQVVGEAVNGVEAVSIALNTQPAIVILDYLMPRCRGDVTASLLRSMGPDTKIVAFSAVLDAKPAWSDSYLNKERISEVAPLLERLIVSR